jgi:hypothetical protein
MPKVYQVMVALSVVLISGTTKAAFSSPLNYPIVQSLDNYTPFCYIQTDEGKTLDLSHLCGFASPDICFDVTNKPALAVILKDFCKKHERCSLTCICHDIPQTLNRPHTDSPL